MKGERRSFTKEFKLMAVELFESGKSTKEVALDLDIRPELVRRWRREYGKYKEGSFSGHGTINMTDAQKENVQLKKALRESQLECEILKKAVGIFTASPRYCHKSQVKLYKYFYICVTEQRASCD